MIVLFVSSGNNNNKISPIINNQGNSLIKEGIDVRFFLIKGKGIKGYIKNIKKLRSYLNENKIDIIHAHYGLSGLVVCFAKKKEKAILSFMGDDIYGSIGKEGNVLFLSKILVIVNKFFAKRCMDYIIVKSKNMKKMLNNINNIEVIPNGVDFNVFQPDKNIKAPPKNKTKKTILFASDPKRMEKNYSLAKQAIKKIKRTDIILKVVYNQSQSKLIEYYNMADVVLITSIHEGSPNVVKEAMACNVPIVSTDVGDVKEIIGNTKGCYISNFDATDVADKIEKALKFSKRTHGRKDITNLDSKNIAQKIIKIYEKVLEK